MRHRVRGEERVAVERHHHLAAGFGESQIERTRFAAVGLAEDAHAGVAAELLVQHRQRPVLRAVVDADHLEHRRLLGEQRLHRAHDDRIFVVGGNDHADAQPPGRRRCSPSTRATRLERREHREQHRPQGEEPDGESKEGPERPRQPSQHHEDDTVRARHERRRPRCGRHELVARHPRHLLRRGDRDSPRRQAVEDEGQRRQRGGAIAPAVVQEDDRPLPELRQHPVRDGLRVMLAEILRVDVLPQGQVPEPRRARDHLRVLPLVERLVGMVRRPEEPRLPPGDPLQQALVDVQLHLHPQRRDAREVGMREGMVPHHVPLGELALHQIRPRLRVLADEEEDRLHSARVEQIEDLRRPLRVGPVVEGEEHLALGVRSLPLEDPARRILLVVDVRDVPLRVPGDGAPPRLRPRLQAEQLALAQLRDVVGGVGGDDAVEALARQRLVEAAWVGRLAEEIEDLRILRSQAPDGDAADVQRRDRLQLRRHGRRVEESDLVLLVRRVVVVLEEAALRLLVPLHRDLVLACQRQRLREAQLFGGTRPVAVAVERPVVSVGAQRDDDLVGRRELEIGGHAPRHVLRSGDGPGIVGRGVLVVRHHHQEVAGGREPRDRHALRLRGHVDAEEEPARMQLRPRRLDERGELLPERGIEVLEVEVDAGEPALLAQFRQALRRVLARGRIRQERLEHRSLELAAFVVRDGGRQFQPRRRLRHARVFLDEEAPAGPEPDPFRHQVRELIGVRLQRDEALLVPVDGEPGQDGLARIAGFAPPLRRLRLREQRAEPRLFLAVHALARLALQRMPGGNLPCRRRLGRLRAERPWRREDGDEKHPQRRDRRSGPQHRRCAHRAPAPSRLIAKDGHFETLGRACAALMHAPCRPF